MYFVESTRLRADIRDLDPRTPLQLRFPASDKRELPILRDVHRHRLGAGSFVYEVTNVLTPAACAQIAQAALPYATMLSPGYARTILEPALNEEFADELCEALLQTDALAARLLAHADRAPVFSQHVQSWSNTFTANPCVRVSRYDAPADGLALHYDSPVTLPDRYVSSHSVVLVLHAADVGGETEFIARKPATQCGLTPAEAVADGIEASLLLKPTIGSALIFSQRLLHRGCPVRAGHKVLLRTDLLRQYTDAGVTFDQSKLVLARQLFREAELAELSAQDALAYECYSRSLDVRMAFENADVHAARATRALQRRQTDMEPLVLSEPLGLQLRSRNAAKYVFAHRIALDNRDQVALGMALAAEFMLRNRCVDSDSHTTLRGYLQSVGTVREPADLPIVKDTGDVSGAADAARDADPDTDAASDVCTTDSSSNTESEPDADDLEESDLEPAPESPLPCAGGVEDWVPNHFRDDYDPRASNNADPAFRGAMVGLALGVDAVVQAINAREFKDRAQRDEYVLEVVPMYEATKKYLQLCGLCEAGDLEGVPIRKTAYTLESAQAQFRSEFGPAHARVQFAAAAEEPWTVQASIRFTRADADTFNHASCQCFYETRCRSKTVCGPAIQVVFILTACIDATRLEINAVPAICM